MKIKILFAILLLSACNVNPSPSGHKRKVLGPLNQYSSSNQESEENKEADAEDESPIAQSEEPVSNPSPSAPQPAPAPSPAPADPVAGPVPAPTPAPSPAPAPNSGETLFATNCSPCHGNGAAIAGSSAATIINALNTIPQMAGMKARFPVVNNANAELDAISAYLQE